MNGFDQKSSPEAKEQQETELEKAFAYFQCWVID